jgi:hypothetical protein
MNCIILQETSIADVQFSLQSEQNDVEAQALLSTALETFLASAAAYRNTIKNVSVIDHMNRLDTERHKRCEREMVWSTFEWKKKIL